MIDRFQDPKYCKWGNFNFKKLIPNTVNIIAVVYDDTTHVSKSFLLEKNYNSTICNWIAEKTWLRDTNGETFKENDVLLLNSYEKGFNINYSNTKGLGLTIFSSPIHHIIAYPEDLQKLFPKNTKFAPTTIADIDLTEVSPTEVLSLTGIILKDLPLKTSIQEFVVKKELTKTYSDLHVEKIQTSDIFL